MHQNDLLKQLERTVLNKNNKMHMLATKFVAKFNSVDGNFPDDLLKCSSDCKGESLVSNENSSRISTVRLTNEVDNFYQSTSVSDYLLNCGNVDMNYALG